MCDSYVFRIFGIAQSEYLSGMRLPLVECGQYSEYCSKDAGAAERFNL